MKSSPIMTDTIHTGREAEAIATSERMLRHSNKTKIYWS